MKNYNPSYYPSTSQVLPAQFLSASYCKWQLRKTSKLVYSFCLTLDNIKNVFFNFHNFDFTAPLKYSTDFDRLHLPSITTSLLSNIVSFDEH